MTLRCVAVLQMLEETRRDVEGLKATLAAQLKRCESELKSAEERNLKGNMQLAKRAAGGKQERMQAAEVTPS